MLLLKNLLAAIEQNLLPVDMEKRGVLCAQAFVRKRMIWKKPVAVNPEFPGNTISLTVLVCSNTIPRQKIQGSQEVKSCWKI